MTSKAGKKSRIWVGELNAGCYARSASFDSSDQMIDVTTFCSDEDEEGSMEFTPANLDTGTFDISGPLDSDGTSGSQWATLADLKAVTDGFPVTFAPLGADPGTVQLLKGLQATLADTSNVGSSNDWSMQVQTTGQYDMNGSLLQTATVTADGSSTAIDNGAATSDGGVAHLHVTAFSGFTSDDIIIEGSTTGAFAGEETTIVTFSQVTATGYERMLVAGTIPQHLRVTHDVATTGSITVAVAFARR